MTRRAHKFIDIAVNLTDCVFVGVDRKGRKIHESDLALVVSRAVEAGVGRMIITGTSLDVSREAVEMCRQFPGKCYCTVGIHPAHVDEFLDEATRKKFTPVKQSTKKSQQAPAGTKKKAVAAAAAASAAPVASSSGGDATQQVGDGLAKASEDSTVAPPPSSAVPATADVGPKMDPVFAGGVMDALRELIVKNRDVVVAVGECGLDYAELSPAVTESLQAEGFKLQLLLAQELSLPLLLHSRDCRMDFVDQVSQFLVSSESLSLLKKNISKLPPLRGVVHSFNGDKDELSAILHKLGLSIGLNASAFRDQGICKDIVNAVPDDRLMIETDAPWCDPRPTDWGYPIGQPVIDAALPPFVAKEKFEMGKCVNRRNEPATLPAVFAMLCAAKRIISTSDSGGKGKDGDDDDDDDAGASATAQTKKVDEAVDKLADAIHRNSMNLFFPNEKM